MLDIIWYDQCLGNWDHGLIDSCFIKHQNTFKYHNSKELIYPDRAIIIVSGRPLVEPLKEYLSKIKSGIVILTSEEDAFFDWNVIPKHLELWTQYFAPSKEAIKTRLLLGAPNRIKDYKINTHLPKKYLWSFVGQIQNPSRQKCAEVLRGLPDGFLHIAEAFGGQENGIEYQEYLDIMCQSKFVICPAGSMCVDSFRLYEALECGAIPITEERSPRDKDDFKYWDAVYHNHDVLTVEDWKEIPSIINNDWYSDTSNWWSNYKLNLEIKLLLYAK